MLAGGWQVCSRLVVSIFTLITCIWLDPLPLSQGSSGGEVGFGFFPTLTKLSPNLTFLAAAP